MIDANIQKIEDAIFANELSAERCEHVPLLDYGLHSEVDWLLDAVDVCAWATGRGIGLSPFAHRLYYCQTPQEILSDLGISESISQKRKSRLEDMKYVLDELVALSSDPITFDGAVTLPGSMKELRRFLEWRLKETILPARNDDLGKDLDGLGVRFARGRKTENAGKHFYQSIFPDFPG